MLVDSHCHLNFKDFEEDIEAVIARARENGVGVMQTICTELEEFPEHVALTERFDDLYCSVGVHPNDSGKTKVASVEDLVERSRHPKVIGIGETGLDYHYEKSDRKTQIESFRNHITASRETQLPLIVHTRDADQDTIDILTDEAAKGAFPCLIHCFTSTRYLADRMIELGAYLSVSGIVTFKNATDIQDTIRAMPLDRLLVETDAPYLAPIPFRGKRNEPSFTLYTNAFLAKLKEVSPEVSAAATTENFFRLFTKASLPKPLHAH